MQPISLTVPCDVIVGNNLGHHGSIALAEGLPHSGLTVLRASGAAVLSSMSHHGAPLLTFCVWRYRLWHWHIWHGVLGSRDRKVATLCT